MANIIYFRTVKVDNDGLHDYFRVHSTLNGEPNIHAKILGESEEFFRITKEEYLTRSRHYEMVPNKGTIVNAGVDDITGKKIQDIVPLTIDAQIKRASKANRKPNSSKLAVSKRTGKLKNLTHRTGKFLRNKFNLSKDVLKRNRWREKRLKKANLELAGN